MIPSDATTVSVFLDGAHSQKAKIEKLTMERDAYKAELISVLRSLLALANCYCANKTSDYAETRLKELEATQ